MKPRVHDFYDRASLLSNKLVRRIVRGCSPRTDWALVQLRLRQLHKHHEALNQSRLELAHVERLATLST